MRAAVLTALLLAGCSYQVLPGSASRSTGPLRLRYERTKLFFHSVEEARPGRIFAGAGAVLAEVSDPASGFFTSPDGGATWTLASMPVPIVEVISVGRFLYARGLRQVYRSHDGGRSWSLAVTGGADVEALAAASDGRIFVGASGRVFASSREGGGLRGLALQGVDAARFRSVAAVGQTLLASTRASASRELLPAVRDVLDGRSAEADAALDAKQAVSFSSGMIYLSHDGGALWKKSTLGLDAWLSVHDGAVYAVAADPLLEAAAAARAHPGLARALSQQLHDQRVDADDVRSALAWPGEEALLRGGFALVFRSNDGGESWTRIAEVPPEVRADIARQQAAYPVEPEVAREVPRIVRRPGQPRAAQPRPASVPPHVTDEVLLSFLDPVRLLARQNHGPIEGFATAGGEVWAFLPTRAQWESLSAAVVAGTVAEGEIWLGILRPPRGPEAELFRSAFGGGFSKVGGLPAGVPTSIAALPGVGYLTLRGQGAVQIVP